MKMEFGRDDLTPALEQLVRNASPEKRKSVLAVLASRLSNRIKTFMEAEKNYDGTPMKSPSSETKFDGRFAKSYNWRYRPGWKLASEEKAKARRQVQESTVINKKGYAKTRYRVRRRVPVTAESKQLQDTGATIKSIDILSVGCDVARVGPKTGHGQKVLSVHQENKDIPEQKRRRPIGISDEFADEVIEYATSELMKGV